MDLLPVSLGLCGGTSQASHESPPRDRELPQASIAIIMNSAGSPATAKLVPDPETVECCALGGPGRTSHSKQGPPSLHPLMVAITSNIPATFCVKLHSTVPWGEPRPPLRCVAGATGSTAHGRSRGAGLLAESQSDATISPALNVAPRG
eukprot:scaffold759_cov119-Isochrysis_galbana.AAC.8